MKIGCCTSVENMEVLDRLGYDFVDLPGARIAAMEEAEFEHLRQELRAGRLKCMAFHASVPPGIRMTGDKIDERANGSYLKRLISRGKQLNIRYIGIGSPNSRTVPEGYSIAKADGQMLHFLETACEIAGNGVDILLESLNRTETNYINSISHAAALVERSGRANLGLVLDIYHFLREGEDPGILSGELLEKVRYVHIAEPVKRGFPAPGQTDVFAEVLKRLDEFGYKGDISIEAMTNAFDTDAEAGLKALRALYGK